MYDNPRREYTDKYHAWRIKYFLCMILICTISPWIIIYIFYIANHWANSCLPKLYCSIISTPPRYRIYFGNHLHKRSPLNNLAGRTPLRYKQPTKDHGQKKSDSCANTAVVLITDPFVPERTSSNPLHILRGEPR